MSLAAAVSEYTTSLEVAGFWFGYFVPLKTDDNITLEDYLLQKIQVHLLLKHVLPIHTSTLLNAVQAGYQFHISSASA